MDQVEVSRPVVSDRLPPTEFYNANVGLIHTVAARIYKRILATGVSIDYEDIFQDLCVDFLRAYEKFDVDAGWQFSSYFTRCAYNNSGARLNGMIAERVENGTRSIQEMSRDMEDGASLEEVVLVDESMMPESQLLESRFLATLDEKLSSLAVLMVNWLVEPPNELVQEFDAYNAHVAYAKTMGLKRPSSPNIELHHVGDFMEKCLGVSGSSIRSAMKEVQSVVAKFIQ